MAAFGQASFDGHFADVTGSNITVDLVFEIPFDCVLIHASAFANSASAVDGSVSIFKNDGSHLADHIVDPGAMVVETDVIHAVDLANLVAYAGEKITIRLNLLSLNTVQKCKWVLACAAQVAPLAA